MLSNIRPGFSHSTASAQAPTQLYAYEVYRAVTHARRERGGDAITSNDELGLVDKERNQERQDSGEDIEDLDLDDVRDKTQWRQDPTLVAMAIATPTASHVTRDANGTFQVSREAVVRYGHFYQRLLVEGQARVHLGDQITVNHYYGQPRIARGHPEQYEAAEGNTDDDMTLAATNLLQNFEGNTVQLLRFLQSTGAKLPLPKQMDFKFVAFEDALGDMMWIDTGFVTDWTSFHYVLSRSFRNRPGHARVAQGSYRIADQGDPNELVDPILPDLSFEDLFQPGKHVQMSILFFEEEIEKDVCARCGRAQIPAGSDEIVCSRCNFRYHGQVMDHTNARATKVRDDRSG